MTQDIETIFLCSVPDLCPPFQVSGMVSSKMLYFNCVRILGAAEGISRRFFPFFGFCLHGKVAETLMAKEHFSSSCEKAFNFQCSKAFHF